MAFKANSKIVNPIRNPTQGAYDHKSNAKRRLASPVFLRQTSAPEQGGDGVLSEGWAASKVTVSFSAPAKRLRCVE